MMNVLGPHSQSVFVYNAKMDMFFSFSLEICEKCGCKRVRSVAKGSQVNYFVPESILSVNQVFSDSVISIK
jgi:hypothetical protein